MFVRGVMTPSLMPAGPDAQHMLDPYSMSVVIVIVIEYLARLGSGRGPCTVALRASQTCVKREPTGRVIIVGVSVIVLRLVISLETATSWTSVSVR